MFDQTLDLFLLDPAPEIKVIKILCSHLAEIVQQIKVKISCSCLFQGCFKLCCRIFSCLAVDPCCVLGLFYIDGVVIQLRKTHQTESKFLDFFA